MRHAGAMSGGASRLFPLTMSAGGDIAHAVFGVWAAQVAA